eukprot:CAMPEP_0174275324 /NCGR_PEP_ID=MMETSP0439-20130205/59748_1 /TAXON_ID=0 /ORGANISM="Stereomyxa ramosa, Strain Chinc5" /LENGTH=138 /DNA_ID=CAMNT_0015367415 /DNA_START=222 /DNA_END=638 /DNA_ORIENTATION=+
MVKSWNFTSPHPNFASITTLFRNDLEKFYEITETMEGEKECSSRNASEKLEGVWDWMRHAVYNSTRVFNHRLLVFWSAQVNGSSYLVGVAPDLHGRRVPYYYWVNNTHFVTEYNFTLFDPSPPHPSYFDVPSICTPSQ